MNSAGSYVQESSRKKGPKGMKGKTRHVTSTPPSPTNTHASFVFRSRRSSGMLIQLAQLAKPGTKKNSSNSSRNHCFPHGAAFLAYAAPLSTAVTWLERLLLLGCRAILFLVIFFLTDPMAASPRDIWMAQAPPSCVSSHCALSLRWHWLLVVVSLIGLTACQSR